MLSSLQKIIRFLGLVSGGQVFLCPQLMDNWTLEISKEWDVLGPFPIGAREQHFLSPSFPLDLSTSYTHQSNRNWTSAYADGGEVRWSKLNATDDGLVLVSFPNIRWGALRATEGWAALQHHNVLHTTLKITPPSVGRSLLPPRLSFSVTRGSFFTLVPTHLVSSNGPFTPEWHPGNIYEIHRPPKQLVDLPYLSSIQPTTYDLFVSGDYEIRIFGDPMASWRPEPILDIGVGVTLEPPDTSVELDPTLDATCDFVDGWAFGTALGVGLRVTTGWWDVLDVSTSQNLSLSLLRSQRLAPAQSRILGIKITQNATVPFQGDSISLNIKLCNAADSRSYDALRATYFLAEAPTLYLALPPLQRNVASPRPPILALHGAGVDIIENAFWSASLPRQRHSWIILPAGRTSWGFDWHGPSADDVWGSLSALTDLVTCNTHWTPWEISKGTRVVLVGHSNGGQGTWHLAARYPDRVLAAVPAAAYIKGQQYIPLSLSRGYHFVDPSLRAILDASIAPDDNDLFLSNIVDMKILAIHGGDDENVPTWHSRELVGLVKSWKQSSDVSLLEEDGKRHWYPEILASPRVQNFLSSVLANNSMASVVDGSFTLTVATPRDSGSLHGLRIEELEIPGRLGRLHITETVGSMSVRTTNVRIFSINATLRYGNIYADGTNIPLQSEGSTIYIQKSKDSWKILSELPQIRAAGPLSQIMHSMSPLVIVVPAEDQHSLSIGTRIAHSMLHYFRVHSFYIKPKDEGIHKGLTQIDSEIITDAEALSKDDSDLATGDLLVIGANNTFGSNILQGGPGLIVPTEKGFSVRGKKFEQASIGLLFLHPHPFSVGQSTIFLWGTDCSGLERAVRLMLPFRTGITLPEFIILGGESDTRGVGGVLGAGFWDRTWGWSDTMSWLD